MEMGNKVFFGWLMFTSVIVLSAFVHLVNISRGANPELMLWTIGGIGFLVGSLFLGNVQKDLYLKEEQSPKSNAQKIHMPALISKLKSSKSYSKIGEEMGLSQQQVIRLAKRYGYERGRKSQ